MKARDEGKGEMAAKQPAVVEEPRHTRNPPPPPTGYSRYDQERFRGKEGKEIGLCDPPSKDQISTVLISLPSVIDLMNS